MLRLALAFVAVVMAAPVVAHMSDSAGGTIVVYDETTPIDEGGWVHDWGQYPSGWYYRSPQRGTFADDGGVMTFRNFTIDYDIDEADPFYWRYHQAWSLPYTATWRMRFRGGPTYRGHELFTYENPEWWFAIQDSETRFGSTGGANHRVVVGFLTGYFESNKNNLYGYVDLYAGSDQLDHKEFYLDDEPMFTNIWDKWIDVMVVVSGDGLSVDGYATMDGVTQHFWHYDEYGSTSETGSVDNFENGIKTSGFVWLGLSNTASEENYVDIENLVEVYAAPGGMEWFSTPVADGWGTVDFASGPAIYGSNEPSGVRIDALSTAMDGAVKLGWVGVGIIQAHGPLGGG